MAKADVAFHPEASEEYREASNWYARHGESVARRFEAEIERTLDRIVDAPQRWSMCDDLHRSVLARRFPYLVIYRQLEGRIWIAAVAHARRQPGYWRGRDPR